MLFYIKKIQGKFISLPIWSQTQAVSRKQQMNL